ncbi:helix-turn-helix domain-containing protein [Mucilaginibacter sp. KACC 22773]|uniref:helix-turn-helix domain-containing protein n=1 Tax=Mucilaginibacter sp. KACC 22773 TaxID=3025671 RepID=UPI002365CE7C|nr:helix-turn-helix domain-containing protein [Mucilaginibacter sp. KACC 22773]WDF79541.1 helix-turn-helix domain-containing protein [Mucilaginibacter sp. KACC 22773]
MEKIILEQYDLAELKEIFRELIREELAAALGNQSTPTIRQPANKKEAAAYLGISESTLNTMISVGTIPYFKIGRKVRFKWRDIEAYVNSKGN